MLIISGCFYTGGDREKFSQPLWKTLYVNQHSLEGQQWDWHPRIPGTDTNDRA